MKNYTPWKTRLWTFKRFRVAGSYGLFRWKSYQEIADELKRHIKSIDNALQRVKRKLERYLELRGGY